MRSCSLSAPRSRRYHTAHHHPQILRRLGCGHCMETHCIFICAAFICDRPTALLGIKASVKQETSDPLLVVKRAPLPRKPAVAVCYCNLGPARQWVRFHFLLPDQVILAAVLSCRFAAVDCTGICQYFTSRF